MFLGYQNNEIALIAETKEALQNTPCMVFDRIEETAAVYELYNGRYMPAAEAAVLKERAAKQARIQAFQEQLEALDFKAIRALRAVSAGTATAADQEQLSQLDQQAAQIRLQMKETV